MGVNQISNAGVAAAAYQVQQTQQAQPASDSKVMEQATDATMTNAAILKKTTVTKPQDKQRQAGDEPHSEEQEDMSQKKIKKAIDTINKQLSHTECQYGFHEKTNRVTIKIVDKDTDKIIKEFPPEETLEMIAKAWELAGLLVDEKR